MKAAIYVRKSTEQAGAPTDAERSVARQEVACRAFVEARGWELIEVFPDDGVSGALFLGRPGFQAMKRAAEAGAFSELVVWDMARFARHPRAMAELDALDDTGVTVWTAHNGQSIELDSFAGRIKATVDTGYSAEYIAQITKDTRNSLETRARNGHVAGGITYGYLNVRSREANHATREVNEAEAKVVRRIYQRYAAGVTISGVAKELNSDGVPPPSANDKRRGRGPRPLWNSTTVRRILQRPLYRGVAVWGLTQRLKGKQLKRALRARGTPEHDRRLSRNPGRERGQLFVTAEPITAAVPEARIISEALAARVDARLAGARKADRGGKPPGEYLLTGGMLVCTCGSYFEVKNRTYMCARRRRHGVEACDNKARLPIAATDDALLEQVEEALSPEFVESLLAGLAPAPADERPALEADLARLKAELRRLVDSLAAGVPASSVAAAISEREASASAIEERLAKPAPKGGRDVAALRKQLGGTVASVRKALRAEPAIARAVLRQMMGPLTFHHDGSAPPEWISQAKTEWLPPGLPKRSRP